VANAKNAKRPVEVGLGTDVGGGTSFSQLATMGAAYEIAQLGGRALSAVEAFYLATLGGARALALEERVGTIAPGREADLVVLDPKATSLLTLRQARANSVEDVLFALMTLGDDRSVRATYIAGQRAHDRDA
jgi:guanine deaminase